MALYLSIVARLASCLRVSRVEQASEDYMEKLEREWAEQRSLANPPKPEPPAAGEEVGDLT